MNSNPNVTLFSNQDTLSKLINTSDSGTIKQPFKVTSDSVKKQSFSFDSKISRDRVKTPNSNACDTIKSIPEFIKISTKSSSLLSSYRDNFMQNSSKDNICYIVKKQYFKENRVVFYNEKNESTSYVEKSLLAKERSYVNNDWIIVPILLGMIILASILTFYRKYIGQLFESTIYLFASKKIKKDKTVPYQRMTIFLDIIFILSFSILIDLTIKRLEIYAPPTQFKYIIFLGVAVFLLVMRLFRLIAYKLSAFISNQQIFFSELLDSSTLFSRTLGIFLLPMVFLISYSTALMASLLIYLSLFAVSIMLIFRILRIYRVFIVGGFSIFYFILYLCALEIAPLLVIWKEVKPR